MHKFIDKTLSEQFNEVIVKCTKCKKEFIYNFKDSPTVMYYEKNQVLKEAKSGINIVCKYCGCDIVKLKTI